MPNVYTKILITIQFKLPFSYYVVNRSICYIFGSIWIAAYPVLYVIIYDLDWARMVNAFSLTNVISCHSNELQCRHAPDRRLKCLISGYCDRVATF